MSAGQVSHGAAPRPWSAPIGECAGSSGKPLFLQRSRARALSMGSLIRCGADDSVEHAELGGHPGTRDCAPSSSSRKPRAASVSASPTSARQGRSKPSPAACRENLRKEKDTRRIEQGLMAARQSTGRDSRFDDNLPHGSISHQLDFEQAVDAFQQDVSQVDHMLQDIHKHMHQGWEMKSEDDLREIEREKERKRREEMQRRLRQEQKDARDPKRKIALRLENKRRFESNEPDWGAGIPMQHLEINGAHGKEKVSVVDIRMLRTKCQHLDGSGTSVRALLEENAREERRERSMFRSVSLPNAMQSSPAVPGNSIGRPVAGLSYEEKLLRVQQRKQQQYRSNIWQKLGAFRNSLALPA